MRESPRVVTDDLGRVLRAWRVEYEKLHPPHMGQQPNGPGSSSLPTFMPVMQKIGSLSGVNIRVIYRIMNVEMLTTDLYIADRLLTAIDLEYKLYDGSIRILSSQEYPEAYRLATYKRGVGQRFKNMEEWLEYLDKIGCRR